MHDPGTRAVALVGGVVTAGIVVAIVVLDADIASVVAGVAAAFFVILGLYSKRVAWVMLVSAVFANRLAITVGAVTLRPEHLALMVFLCSLILHRREGRKTLVGALGVAIALLGIWLGLSAVSSSLQAPEPPRSYYIVLLTASSIIAMVAVRADPSDNSWRVRSSAVVLSIASLVSVGSWVLAQFAGIPSDFVAKAGFEDFYRVQWLAFEPNIFASLCVLWLCLIYAYRNTFRPVWLSVHVIVIGVALLLTFTRAAWIAALILAGLALIRAKRLGSRLPIAILGGSLVLGLASFVSLTGPVLVGLSERIGSLIDFGEGTGAYRANTWAIAWDQLGESRGWVLGLGTNSFSQRNLAADTSTGEAYLGNFWLALVYDSGIVGFLLFVVAFVLIWWSSSPRLEAGILVLAIVLTAATTSQMWFAYAWIALGLLRPRAPSPSLSGRGGQTQPPRPVSWSVIRAHRV